MGCWKFSTFLWLSKGQIQAWLEVWATTGWVSGRKEVVKVTGPTNLWPGPSLPSGEVGPSTSVLVVCCITWLLDYFPSLVLLLLHMQRMEFLSSILIYSLSRWSESLSCCSFHLCPQLHGVSSLLSFLCFNAQPCLFYGPLDAAQTHTGKLWAMFLLYPDLFFVSTIYNMLHTRQTYPASNLSLPKCTQLFVFWTLTFKLI